MKEGREWCCVDDEEEDGDNRSVGTTSTFSLPITCMK